MRVICTAGGHFIHSGNMTRLGAELCAPWAAIYPLNSCNTVVECYHVYASAQSYVCCGRLFYPLDSGNPVVECSHVRVTSMPGFITFFVLALRLADKLEYFVGTIPHGRIPTSI